MPKGDYTNHQSNCACPICRSLRGERKRNNNKKYMHVMLEKKLIEYIDKQAERDGVTKTRIVEQALEYWLFDHVEVHKYDT